MRLLLSMGSTVADRRSSEAWSSLTLGMIEG